MEPFFYKGMTLIRFNHKLIDKSDTKKRAKYYQNALKNFEKALNLNGNNANLLYHYAILKFAMGYQQDCIQDLDKAIEKSEDNIPKYFFLRGLAYACQNCLK
jgi:tetratricopeptide (TPR) repeat protein